MAGLRKLDLNNNRGGLGALLEGLWSLMGLKELCMSYYRLTVLPEGVARLTGLQKLHLSGNVWLTTLPEGLWSLAGLEELYLAEDICSW
jgi:Leucine-rich repeat (LRR) protein